MNGGRDGIAHPAAAFPNSRARTLRGEDGAAWGLMQELSAEQVPARRALVSPCSAPGVGMIMIPTGTGQLAAEERELKGLKADEDASLSVSKELQTVSGCGGSWFLSNPLPGTSSAPWAALTSGCLCSAHGRVHLQEALQPYPVELKLQQLSGSERDLY